MSIRFWLAFAGLSLTLGVSKAVESELAVCVSPSNAILVTDPATNCDSPRKVARINALHDGKAFRPPQTNRHDFVEKVIIVVHAAGESDVFTTISTRLDEDFPNPDDRKKIWLVALQFSGGAEDGNWLRWSPAASSVPGYAVGNVSAYPSGVQVSSFKLLDHLVVRMENWAPNVKEFIIVGFGQNAELVNRYSIGTDVENDPEMTGPAGASVRYLMAGAGRYTYLSNKRYEYNFGELPKERSSIAAACDTTSDGAYFDKYPYGLTGIGLNHYMQVDLNEANNILALKKRVAGKRRLFLVGNNDTADDLDEFLPADPAYHRCPAKQQGRTRRSRAFNYVHHLRSEYHSATIGTTPPGTTEYKLSLASGAGFCVIQNVGHDAASMLNTPAAQLYLKHDMVHCALNDATDDPPPPSLPVQQDERRRR